MCCDLVLSELILYLLQCALKYIYPHTVVFDRLTSWCELQFLKNSQCNRGMCTAMHLEMIDRILKPHHSRNSRAQSVIWQVVTEVADFRQGSRVCLIDTHLLSSESVAPGLQVNC